jgi:hypothetical protein
MSAARQQNLDCPCEALEMRLQWRIQGVEPVNVSDEVLEPLARKYVLDPHR